MALGSSINTKEFINKFVDKFEPETDPDRADNGNGIPVEAPGRTQSFFNLLRRAPLRKLLTITTYLVDIILIIVGFIFQKDLPPEIAAGWNVSRITIYTGYFGSSTAESIVNSNNKTRSIMQSSKQTITTTSASQCNKNETVVNDVEIIGKTEDGTPIIVDSSVNEP